MLLRIQLIEGFIKLSDGLVVLLSWNYFSRLWCIYEWACFLWLHHPRDVRIGCDAFLKDDPQETLPLYISSIESISVAHAQCSHEADHAMLEEKVFRYYQGSTREESFASFERFAQCTAICFMAKQIMLWRTRNVEEETAWLGPLKDLAAKLGFTDLLAVFEEAMPSKWWSQCSKDRFFRRIVQSWFEKVAVRYLLRERRRAVRTKWQIRDIDAARGSDESFEDSRGPGEANPKEFGKTRSWSLEPNFALPQEDTAFQQSGFTHSNNLNVEDASQCQIVNHATSTHSNNFDGEDLSQCRAVNHATHAHKICL